MNEEKNCYTCGNRCMDMDLDPYCAAPKVLKAHPYSLVLRHGAPKECLVEGEYTLWEEDLRQQR